MKMNENMVEENSLIEAGEKHGIVLSSFIISQIFVGEMTIEGCSSWREFADRVVGMVFSHFNLSYHPLQPNTNQNPNMGVEGNRLKIVSETISREVIEKLTRSVLSLKDFSRILRTSHNKLLECVCKSEDLRDDLIDELVNDLDHISVSLDTPKTLRDTLDKCLERVLVVLRQRSYNLDDGTGYVSL